MSDERLAKEKMVSDIIDWITSAPKGTSFSKCMAMAERVGYEFKWTQECLVCQHLLYIAWYNTHT
jgi:hypothetical protein